MRRQAMGLYTIFICFAAHLGAVVAGRSFLDRPRGIFKVTDEELKQSGDTMVDALVKTRAMVDSAVKEADALTQQVDEAKANITLMAQVKGSVKVKASDMTHSAEDKLADLQRKAGIHNKEAARFKSVKEAAKQRASDATRELGPQKAVIEATNKGVISLHARVATLHAQEDDFLKQASAAKTTLEEELLLLQDENLAEKKGIDDEKKRLQEAEDALKEMRSRSQQLMKSAVEAKALAEASNKKAKEAMNDEKKQDALVTEQEAMATLARLEEKRLREEMEAQIMEEKETKLKASLADVDPLFDEGSTLMVRSNEEKAQADELAAKEKEEEEAALALEKEAQEKLTQADDIDASADAAQKVGEEAEEQAVKEQGKVHMTEVGVAEAISNSESLVRLAEAQEEVVEKAKLEEDEAGESMAMLVKQTVDARSDVSLLEPLVGDVEQPTDEPLVGDAEQPTDA